MEIVASAGMVQYHITHLSKTVAKNICTIAKHKSVNAKENLAKEYIDWADHFFEPITIRAAAFAIIEIVAKVNRSLSNTSIIILLVIFT